MPPRLEDRADEEKTFQSLPKDGVLWQGRAGELCPAQLGAALSPGRAPRCTTPRGVSPALSRGSPAAGGCRKGTGPAEPCRAVPCPFTEGCKCSVAGFQGGTRACSCGAPVKQRCICVFTETLDFFSFGSALLWVGEGSPVTAVFPYPASPPLPAALWGTGQRRGCAGQGLVLSRDAGCTWNCHTLKQDTDRGHHLSPCNCWRWPNPCTQCSQQSCSKLPQGTMGLFIRKSQPQCFLSFAKAQQLGKMSCFNVDAQL